MATKKKNIDIEIVLKNITDLQVQASVLQSQQKKGILKNEYGQTIEESIESIRLSLLDKANYLTKNYGLKGIESFIKKYHKSGEYDAVSIEKILDELTKDLDYISAKIKKQLLEEVRIWQFREQRMREAREQNERARQMSEKSHQEQEAQKNQAVQQAPTNAQSLAITTPEKPLRRPPKAMPHELDRSFARRFPIKHIMDELTGGGSSRPRKERDNIKFRKNENFKIREQRQRDGKEMAMKKDTPAYAPPQMGR